MATAVLAEVLVKCGHCGQGVPEARLDDEFQFCPDCMTLLRAWESAQAAAEAADQDAEAAEEAPELITPQELARVCANLVTARGRLAEAEQALDAREAGE